MVSHQGIATSLKSEPPTGGGKDHRVKPSASPCQDVSISRDARKRKVFELLINHLFSLLTASRSVSSNKKTKDNSKSSKTIPKQETEDGESDPESTEEPEDPTTLPKYRPAIPPSRRLHPVSQTRSYHSILNSLRGTIRGFPRRRGDDIEAEEKEDEEDEETPATTTAPEVTTTIEVEVETNEPKNTISDDVEDNVEYDEESPTTKSPTLKASTPYPTKVSIRPPKRPIKIRVHQKPGSSGSFSTTSLKSATPSTLSISSSDPSPSITSSSSSKTSLSTSHHEEFTEHLNDRVPFKYPQSKKTYDKSSITYPKPATPVLKQTNSQQAGATPEGKGSAATGRTSGTGFGSRYGYSRRYPFLRGNSTRISTGYKPSVTHQSNIPRTTSQEASKTYNSAPSQSTIPDRTRDHRTTETLKDTERAQTKPDQMTYGLTNLQTSQARSNPSSTINTASSQSVSHKASHSSAPVHNTQTSHTSTEQDTVIGEASDNHKSTNKEEHKVKEPTSSAIKKPVQEEIINKEERDHANKGNIGVPSQTRISPSFAERFPWLASRYPGRFGSSGRLSSSRANGRATTSRTSSSVGANTPILRETPTQFSGATGSSGISKIQESSKDLNSPFSDDTHKNGTGLGADKSFASQNTGSGKPINPSLSKSSLAATSSNSETDLFSERQETSFEPIPGEILNEDKNDHSNSYLNEKKIEISGKNDKDTDSSSSQKNPAVNSHLQKLMKEDLNKHEDTSLRTRSGSTMTSQNYPRRGVGFNGRAYPSVTTNRQFSNSRLPVKTQIRENSRTASSESQSSVSSTGSSSPSVSQPVLTSSQKTNISSNSKPATSASSFSSRQSLRGRTRFPGLRGKPTNGGQFKPGNGNGNSKI